MDGRDKRGHDEDHVNLIGAHLETLVDEFPLAALRERNAVNNLDNRVQLSLSLSIKEILGSLKNRSCRLPAGRSERRPPRAYPDRIDIP